MKTRISQTPELIRDDSFKLIIEDAVDWGRINREKREAEARRQEFEGRQGDMFATQERATA